MINFYILILFVAILSVMATYIIYKYIIVRRLTVPKAPHLTMPPAQSTDDSIAIPAIIWSYWHELPVPDLVQRCHDNWRRMAPNHEVRSLHKNTVTQWISEDTIPDYFHKLPPYRQADWLRLELLALYGGIWIDASIILTQSLAWVNKTQRQHKSEYVGFYIEGFTRYADKPIIENWFMAAAQNSVFIRDLAEEFNRAIAMGEAAYLAGLRQQGKFDDTIQLISPTKLHTYLIMHVAASALLNNNYKRYRLAVFRAEDSAFAFHTLVNWSKRTLHFKLALTPCPKQLPFLIKLRGGERDRIGKYLAQGLFYRGSLLAKFLDL